ncbi:movement protein [polyscias citrivirus 1]|uniref:Movement protein n=1 Tax=polyscias citrivirus 1 TaxID=2945986 RepID=A0AAE9S226_9VIRU|nr:movement protein [polyscias citrivirus 1]
MASLINVSSLVNRVKLDQSIIGSDEINKLYGSEAPIVFKDEVKMVIPGNVEGEPIKLQANILTADRLQQIRNTKVHGKEAAYLHLGFVPIAIRSLLPSGNENIWGRCALVDTSRTTSETAVIDQFEFKFSKKQPFAAKLLTVNASVDINCKVSVGSIQVLLELNGIDLREERSVAAIITGLTCTPTNQMVLLHKIESDTPKWSLCNIIEQVEDEEESKRAFENMFKASSSNLIDLGHEQWLDEGKRIPIFGKFALKGMGHKLMPVRRRNLTTKNLMGDYISQVKLETGSLKRSVSGRTSENLLQKYLKDQARSSCDLQLVPKGTRIVGVTGLESAEELKEKIDQASTSCVSDGTK